jgi:hypothetical protein
MRLKAPLVTQEANPERGFVQTDDFSILQGAARVQVHTGILNVTSSNRLGKC